MTTSATEPRAYRGKGAKYASAFASPWAAALDNMPAVPLQSARRAAAGLADTPIDSSAIASVTAQRNARALVAILPWGSAPFVLQKSPPSTLRLQSPQSRPRTSPSGWLPCFKSASRSAGSC